MLEDQLIRQDVEIGIVERIKKMRSLKKSEKFDKSISKCTFLEWSQQRWEARMEMEVDMQIAVASAD